MKLDVLFKEKPCVFALEVFPPKRHSGIESVYPMLDDINTIPWDYVSVTYSAGGDGAKKYTAQLAQRLSEKHHTEPLAHLTCYSSTRAEIDKRLQQLRKAGVENILALRGDISPDAAPIQEFKYASDLIETIRKAGDFYIVAACYPEGHPESGSVVEDVKNLRRKLDAGAGHLVSQLFFDNGQFFRFLNLARKHGVNCPIEAGIMPVVRVEQIRRTISLSSASIPAEFSKLVTKYENDPASFYKAGIDYAIRQIRDLIESGVDGIHLYAMNKPEIAKQVYDGVSDLL